MLVRAGEVADSLDQPVDYEPFIESQLFRRTQLDSLVWHIFGHVTHPNRNKSDPPGGVNLALVFVRAGEVADPLDQPVDYEPFIENHLSRQYQLQQLVTLPTRIGENETMVVQWTGGGHDLALVFVRAGEVTDPLD